MRASHINKKHSLLMLGMSYFEDTSSKGNLRESRKTFEEGSLIQIQYCDQSNIHCFIVVLQKIDKHDVSHT